MKPWTGKNSKLRQFSKIKPTLCLILDNPILKLPDSPQINLLGSFKPNILTWICYQPIIQKRHNFETARKISIVHMCINLCSPGRFIWSLPVWSLESQFELLKNGTIYTNEKEWKYINQCIQIKKKKITESI